MRSLRRSCRRRFRRGGRRPLQRRRSTGVRGSAEGDRHHHGEREADRDSPQHACQERRAPAAVLGNPHATQPMQARVGCDDVSRRPGYQARRVFFGCFLANFFVTNLPVLASRYRRGLSVLFFLPFAIAAPRVPQSCLSDDSVRYLIGRRAALLKSRRGSSWTPRSSDVRARPTIGRAVAAGWTVESRRQEPCPPAVKELLHLQIRCKGQSTSRRRRACFCGRNNHTASTASSPIVENPGHRSGSRAAITALLTSASRVSC